MLTVGYPTHPLVVLRVSVPAGDGQFTTEQFLQILEAFQ
jgi:hypothetical protein